MAYREQPDVYRSLMPTTPFYELPASSSFKVGGKRLRTMDVVRFLRWIVERERLESPDTSTGWVNTHSDVDPGVVDSFRSLNC